jgi:hypothetical protein
MPSSSVAQRNYIFYLRGKYKTKDKTPKKEKWIWEKGWEQIKEGINENKYWITDDNKLIVVPRGKYHHQVVEDYECCLNNGWIRILITDTFIYCNCYNYDNNKFKKIHTFLNKEKNKEKHYEHLPIMIIDDKYGKTKIYKAGLKEEIKLKRYKRYFSEKYIDDEYRDLLVL